MTEADLLALGITPETIAYVLAFGFGFIVFCWSSGFAVGIAVNLIKKL